MAAIDLLEHVRALVDRDVITMDSVGIKYVLEILDGIDVLGRDNNEMAAGRVGDCLYHTGLSRTGLPVKQKRQREEVSTILVKIKGTREEGAHALGVCPVDATMPQIIR